MSLILLGGALTFNPVSMREVGIHRMESIGYSNHCFFRKISFHSREEVETFVVILIGIGFT